MFICTYIFMFIWMFIQMFISVLFGCNLCLYMPILQCRCVYKSYQHQFCKLVQYSNRQLSENSRFRMFRWTFSVVALLRPALGCVLGPSNADLRLLTRVTSSGAQLDRCFIIFQLLLYCLVSVYVLSHLLYCCFFKKDFLFRVVQCMLVLVTCSIMLCQFYNVYCNLYVLNSILHQLCYDICVTFDKYYVS